MAKISLVFLAGFVAVTLACPLADTVINFCGRPYDFSQRNIDLQYLLNDVKSEYYSMYYSLYQTCSSWQTSSYESEGWYSSYSSSYSQFQSLWSNFENNWNIFQAEILAKSSTLQYGSPDYYTQIRTLLESYNSRLYPCIQKLRPCYDTILPYVRDYYPGGLPQTLSGSPRSINDSPISGGPPGGGPLGGGPLGGVPLGGGPLGGGPLGGGPLGGITSPLGNSPLGNIPLGNSPLGNSPLGNSPLGNSPLGNIPLGNSPLGNSPLGNSPLGNSPLGRITSPLDSGLPGGSGIVPGMGSPGSFQFCGRPYDLSCSDFTPDCIFNDIDTYYWNRYRTLYDNCCNWQVPTDQPWCSEYNNHYSKYSQNYQRYYAQYQTMKNELLNRCRQIQRGSNYQTQIRALLEEYQSQMNPWFKDLDDCYSYVNKYYTQYSSSSSSSCQTSSFESSKTSFESKSSDVVQSLNNGISGITC
jgi:hypothetical protein